VWLQFPLHKDCVLQFEIKLNEGIENYKSVVQEDPLSAIMIERKYNQDLVYAVLYEDRLKRAKVTKIFPEANNVSILDTLNYMDYTENNGSKFYVF